MRTGDVHVACVQIDHEHAAPRVSRKLICCSNRRGLEALRLSAGGLHHDMFEAVDLLRRVVLVNLEIGRGEVLNRLAVLCRKHVNAHHVRSRAETGRLRRRRLLRGWRCRRALREQRR